MSLKFSIVPCMLTSICLFLYSSPSHVCVFLLLPPSLPPSLPPPSSALGHSSHQQLTCHACSASSVSTWPWVWSTSAGSALCTETWQQGMCWWLKTESARCASILPYLVMLEVLLYLHVHGYCTLSRNSKEFYWHVFIYTCM